MKQILIFLIISLFMSIYGEDGDGGGNGGNTHCFEYMSLAKMISIDLHRIDQKIIADTNPLIIGKEYIKIFKSLRCIPDENLDRDARSKKIKLTDEETEEVKFEYLTTLDTSKWEKKEKLEKVKLVAHELFVLNGLESEGEYWNSVDVIEIFQDHSKKFKNIKFEDSLSRRSIRWIKNVNDDSYTVFSPLFLPSKDIKTFDSINADKTRRIGVCRYLGFSEYIRASISSDKHWYTSILNREGEFKKHYVSPARIFKSITCK